jgi:hypothetical protein
VGKQHIIELNGKRYDAVTGKMVAITPVSHNPARAAAAAVKHSTMDGFARDVKPQAIAANSVQAHRFEKSKTLMRKTVTKPAAHDVPAATPDKGGAHIEHSASAITGNKLAHAKAVQKSALVRRYNDMAPYTPPQTQPAAKPHQTTRLQAIATATAVKTNPLVSGLANAQSHEQPKTKRPRAHARLAKRLRVSPRIISAGSLVLAVLLIGGFFAYQNIPNLTMRLASARAGMHGTLPAYQPAGFALSNAISYKPGQITIGYKSNSDSRNFKITQDASSWNSETLVENYEALKENSSYLAVPNKGKTVYIYNGSNATWVDGGIWYRIEGDSKLNSDQLLSLANSL